MAFHDATGDWFSQILPFLGFTMDPNKPLPAPSTEAARRTGETQQLPSGISVSPEGTVGYPLGGTAGSRGSFLKELDVQNPELYGQQNPVSVPKAEEAKRQRRMTQTLSAAGELLKGVGTPSKATPPAPRGGGGPSYLGSRGSSAEMQLLSRLPTLREFLAKNPSVTDALFGGL